MIEFNSHERENFGNIIDRLRDKRIFMTGGTGVFGKNLLSSLICLNETINLGAKVTVLARNAEAFASDNPEFCRDGIVDFMSGDVRDFLFPRDGYDFIIHAATPVDITLERKKTSELKSIIIDGTKRVVEFARKCGADKLLLTSSGAVYGVQPPDIKNISEDYTPNPITAYGTGKLEAEKICFENFNNSVVARCYAIVGRWLPLDIHFAAGNFIRDALAGVPITVQSDGRPLRSYLYTSDLIVWLMTVLLKGKPGRAYNVGSEQEISVGDLAHFVSEQSEHKPPVKIIDKSDINAPPPRYIPSTKRAREELGLLQKISLEDGIKRTMEWYKQRADYGKDSESIQNKNQQTPRGRFLVERVFDKAPVQFSVSSPPKTAQGNRRFVAI